ncbi:MAG: 16S rRNA (cytidine(1402)-2'-O)-methyltransferase, partial [Clostridia bacterium]
SGRVENLLGEYCLVVEGKSPENVLNSLATEQHIEYYVSCGFSKMEAIKQTAKDLGVSKNEIYKTTI